jgi:hypothetical protein
MGGRVPYGSVYFLVYSAHQREVMAAFPFPSRILELRMLVPGVGKMLHEWYLRCTGPGGEGEGWVSTRQMVLSVLDPTRMTLPNSLFPGL